LTEAWRRASRARESETEEKPERFLTVNEVESSSGDGGPEHGLGFMVQGSL